MKKFLSAMLISIMSLTLLVGCGASKATDWRDNPTNIINDKYRTYYEVFLYSYCDSDGDGIGDINGLISKLDYIESLGFNGIWLMPVMESPSYHKYDTVDYMKIDSEYGTNDDFKNLVDECHERGINVIIDLAMNHSSSEHPWFKEAYSYIQSLECDEEPDASQCKYVDYYNFSKEKAGGYSEVEDTCWYYESQFVYSMPDLNLLNPDVQKEFEDIASYWLGLGVDGFRLDAVKYFEYGDNDASIDTLSWFNDYVKSVNEDAYIVCECWDTQAVYAKYYASGVDSMFDFAFADKGGHIANAVNGKLSGNGFATKLEEESSLYESYNENFINAPFYTNHDMARSAGFYPGDEGEAKIKIAQALNLFMTGNVFLYYGEELGMKGSGIDENKRAPMQWSLESTDGMCKGPEAMEKFDMKFPPLDEQIDDESSIYSFIKDVVLIRNQNPEIARGYTSNITEISDEYICAIRKTYNDSEIVIIYNLSNEALSVSTEAISQFKTIRGELTTGEEPITVDNTIITLPGYSVIVLGENR